MQKLSKLNLISGEGGGGARGSEGQVAQVCERVLLWSAVLEPGGNHAHMQPAAGSSNPDKKITLFTKIPKDKPSVAFTFLVLLLHP